jgi:hypothetical protein
MPNKRIVLSGFITVEGFHIELQEVNFETDKTTDKVALTLPPGFLDQLFEKWQEFKNGTNKEHCLILRNYFDDHPDMDWVKYLAMEDNRLHGNKGE